MAHSVLVREQPSFRGLLGNFAWCEVVFRHNDNWSFINDVVISDNDWTMLVSSSDGNMWRHQTTRPAWWQNDGAMGLTYTHKQYFYFIHADKVLAYSLSQVINIQKICDRRRLPIIIDNFGDDVTNTVISEDDCSRLERRRARLHFTIFVPIYPSNWSWSYYVTVKISM